MGVDALPIRAVPVAMTGVVPTRVVIVTMDSHLSGAAFRAEADLRRDIPGLQLSIHAADYGVSAVTIETLYEAKAHHGR